MAGNAINSAVAAAPGIEAGLLRSFNNGIYGNITGSMSYFGVGDSRVLTKVDMIAGWQIVRNQAVVVSGKLRQVNSSSLNIKVSTSWQYYF
jgi:hypothetical protein